MKVFLAGVAIAAVALVITQVHENAGAGPVNSVVKPVVKTPRIMVRPRIVTPPTNRLIKKDTVEGVTNPAATQGGSAPEADSPARRRTSAPLRNSDRALAPIPQARPHDDIDIMALLFSVFKESINEQNENKKYWLTRLKQLNTIGDALSDYLSDLAPEASQTGIDNAMAEQILQQIEAVSSAAGMAEADLRASLTAEQFQTVSNIQQMLVADPSSPDARAAWEAFVDEPEMDIDTLIQGVFRQSYLEQTGDLRDYAEKVKRYNEQKQVIRDELDGARAEPCKTTKC